MLSVYPSEEQLLLTVRQVASRLQLSVRTIWRLVAADKLPRPVYPSPRTPRWKQGDIEDYAAALR